MGNARQFAVIGLGRFGSSVALTLAETGFEVLGVDVSEERVGRLADMITHVVTADSTDENSLKALGIRNFDVVVVAIANDIEASVLTTLLLKQQGVRQIIAKANNVLHGRMLEKIGANRIVYPERDMGCRLAHNLVSPNVIDYIQLSPNLGIVEVTVPQSLVGKSLAESGLGVDYGINVIAIKRSGCLAVSPSPDEMLQAGDWLTLIGKDDGIQRLEQLD